MIHIHYNTRRIQESAVRGVLHNTTTDNTHQPKRRRGVYAVFYNNQCVYVDTTNDLHNALLIHDNTITAGVEVLYRYTSSPAHSKTCFERLMSSGIMECVLNTPNYEGNVTAAIRATKKDALSYRPKPQSTW